MVVTCPFLQLPRDVGGHAMKAMTSKECSKRGLAIRTPAEKKHAVIVTIQ